jgi:hypothetical protein
MQCNGAFTKHLIVKLDVDSLVLKDETGKIGRYLNRSSNKSKELLMPR